LFVLILLTLKNVFIYVHGGPKHWTVLGTTKIRKKLSVEKQTICQNFQNYL